MEWKTVSPIGDTNTGVSSGHFSWGTGERIGLCTCSHFAVGLGVELTTISTRCLKVFVRIYLPRNEISVADTGTAQMGTVPRATTSFQQRWHSFSRRSCCHQFDFLEAVCAKCSETVQRLRNQCIKKDR